MEGRNYKVVVVGGGASGIIAAISAKRKGASVVICEKTPRLGKKVLASGNGRCNLANDTLDSSFYNPAARDLVTSVLSRFGINEIKGFFEGIGLKLHSEEGRIFPATGQSASVLKVLEMEMRRLAIPVETLCEVSTVAQAKGGDGFTVSSRSGGSIAAKAVIIACGGKSYPAFGSDGSGYKFAERIGHTIIEPVPAAVPLAVKDPLCHALQGQRITAAAKSIVQGRQTRKAAGDVLFTKYGLSGTAIIDVSEDLSIAFNRNGIKEIAVSVDMVPFMEEAELSEELARRASGKLSPDDMIAGILPNKFGAALREVFRSRPAPEAAHLLKNRVFKVQGTRGWNEADFTAGGIDTDGIEARTMQSKLKNGIYFTGEILDVDGRRGGYNLAWAWASGFVAGESAAHA